jgi:hypothetical protein
MYDDLNENTFLLYAIKCYDSPKCIMSVFEDDMKRIKYIDRLFSKYKNKKILKERLILNHLILLYNVFGPEAVCRILFYKIDSIFYSYLKTFLVYLEICPEIVFGIDGKNILVTDIPIDLTIANTLRNL